MLHTEQTFTTTDGLKLFLRVHLAQKAKGVLVFIHGIGEHTKRYDHWAELFTQHGYHFVTFDLRGHGLSEGKRGHTPTFKQLLDDIDVFTTLVKDAYSDLPLFLYGHSMGGGLVLSYILQYKNPYKALIASAPMLKTAVTPPLWKTSLGRVMRRIWPGLLLPNGLDATLLTHDKAIVQAYVNDPLVHGVVSAELGIGMLDNGVWLLQQTHFPLPLLLLQGTLDSMTSLEATRTFSTHVQGNTTLKAYEGLYHELHNEPDHRAIFEDIYSWLEEVNH